jgi:hypothetical protein
VQLRCRAGNHQERLARYAASSLQRQLRCHRVDVTSKLRVPELTLSLPHWEHEQANIDGFDRLFEKVSSDGDFRLVLWTRDWLAGAQPALELLNRYQRLLPLPLDYRALPELPELLTTRRLLTASRRGNDAWRWLLRMTARPSRPLELAALFHDVLVPEHDQEARAAWSSLACLGVRQADLAEATELASRSALGESGSPELTLLRDAQDLCFFAGESFQFARDRGSAATRAQVELLLGRMSARAVCLALGTRQPCDVSLMMEDALDRDEEPDSGVRRAALT